MYVLSVCGKLSVSVFLRLTVRWQIGHQQIWPSSEKRHNILRKRQPLVGAHLILSHSQPKSKDSLLRNQVFGQLRRRCLMNVVIGRSCGARQCVWSCCTLCILTETSFLILVLFKYNTQFCYFICRSLCIFHLSFESYQSKCSYENYDRTTDEPTMRDHREVTLLIIVS